ncbi:MAG TPA: hypothetical protein VHZ51_12680 [Ktedonobacteraceae bacterium]|nr:hypothetical protein [Ktedonobacteraceae bacterium]
MDDAQTSIATHQEAEDMGHKEQHIHLPNPSLWPLLLSVAILVTLAGVLFIPDAPWLSIIGAPFVLVGILGWALENPMAHREQYVPYRETSVLPSRFKIGQDVVDKDGHWIGLVQARFPHYILVDRGNFSATAFYVPQSVTESDIVDDVVCLAVSESDLRAMHASDIPDDLYEEAPDFALPQVTGVPLFASKPLSPAETGHYNYGPIYPGINTDASGSFQRQDLTIKPQSFVSERKKKYKRPQPSGQN